MSEQSTFIEINPGLGSFGFAAERAGLLRLGPDLLARDVRQAYIDFHGAGSDERLEDSADIVVANLPFSLFLDGKNADPEVTDVIASARRLIRRGGCALFRVKWDIALRLKTDPSAFVATVSAAFPKYSVKSFVDLSGHGDQASTSDLYIVASPNDVILDPSPEAPAASITAIHPVVLVDFERGSGDPQQILSALGFPEDFYRVAGSVPNVDDHIRESVIVSRASAVIETVVSSIRG